MTRFILLSLACWLALLTLTSAIPIDEDALNIWDSFSRNFSRPIRTKEERENRKRTFISNYAQIQANNADFEAGLVSFELGINEFTDMTTDEILKYYTGLKFPQVPIINGCHENETSEEEFLNDVKKRGAPPNWDWRVVTPRVLSPVRNQGQCGSCWAFATVAAAEAAYNRKNRVSSAVFSEQYLLDCETSSAGCDGGWPGYTMDFVKQRGFVSYFSYSPYSQVRRTCAVQSGPFRPASTGYLRNVDDDTLRSVIFQNGPVIVGMDGAFFNFQAYRSGVLNPTCGPQNHAVVVVGYATTGPGAPYWILRNSWGPGWGEGGYFRLSTYNPCKIKDHVWYVKF